MEHVCPICNGLQTVSQNCPDCGTGMQDGGVLANYAGPYSPYMEMQMNIVHANTCVHLLYCPRCHNDMHQAYQLIWI